MAQWLALCAIVLYSAFVPGHVVSQLLSHLPQPAAASEIAAAAHGDHCDKQAPQEQEPSKKSCPFCTGLAAFQVAVDGSATPDTLPRLVAIAATAPEDEIAATQSPGTPKSRSPPVHLV